MLFVIILIGVVVLVPVWGVTRYLSWFSNYELPQVDKAQLPRAAVILAVRGAASSLEECLCRLVNQTYPSYQVHVVVDHPTDPACKIIQDWCSAHPNVSLQVTFLESPSTNAYLKTSSVMQCIGKLPGDVGAVVLVDADTLVYCH